MDFFSMEEPDPKGKKTSSDKKKMGSSSKPGSHIERKGLVIRLRDKSVLFFDDASGLEVFLPISKILDWRFTTSGTKRSLRLIDLEPDDEVTMLIPKWLAYKEGLL